MDTLLALVTGDVTAKPAVVADREALFDAWLEGFDAVAGAGPTVWLVEDVHWASNDTLALLAAAGRSSTRLVVATARPALYEHAPEWVDDVLELNPLDPPDAAALVRHLVGDALPPEIVATVAECSAGNPLFIEELLRSWVSVGALVRRDDRWDLVNGDVAVTMPTTVQAVYAAQLDDLPVAERTLSRRAAVAGRRFPDNMLPSLDLDGVADVVAALERAALVERAIPNAVLGPTHMFRHALLRDAAYATLSRAERARLHLAIAGWLERTAGPRAGDVAEVIARHHLAAIEAAPELARWFDRAATTLLAAMWLERASGRALDARAYQTARSLARESLVLCAGAPALDLARRWELLGRATAYTADMDAGVEAGRQALDLYRAAGDRAGTGRAGLALGLLFIEQLRFDLAGDLADDLLDQLGDVDDPPVGQALVLRAIATLTLTNSTERCAADTARAQRIAIETGDHDLDRAVVAHATAFHVAMPDWLDAFDRIRARAEQSGDGVTVGAMREARGFVQLVSGCADDAARSAMEAREIARAHGVGESVAWADYLLAEARLVTGDWDGALVSARSALERAFAHGYRRVIGRTMGPFATIGVARGDAGIVRELAEWFKVAGPHFPPTPFGLMHTTAWNRWIARGGFGPEKASVAIIESWGINGQCPSWFASAEEAFLAWIEAGRLDDARAGLALYERGVDATYSDLARGFAALLHARLDDGPSYAEQALGLFTSARAPWWQAKALRLLGRDAMAARVETQLEITPTERQLLLEDLLDRAQRREVQLVDDRA